MRICEVIGTVTLNRCHPSLTGARLKLAVPLSLADLAGEPGEPAAELTVYDDLGAGVGSRIAVSEGREAAVGQNIAKPSIQSDSPHQAQPPRNLQGVQYTNPGDAQHVRKIAESNQRPERHDLQRPLLAGLQSDRE